VNPSSSTPDLSESPVLALENNIVWQFENLSEFGAKQLKLQVAGGIFSGEIALDLSATSPTGPSVTAREGGIPEMHIKVSHLELLWAFIYGWMVVYEEGVQKPQLRPDVVMSEETSQLLSRAHELLEWAGSLRLGYTPYPAGLPSPKFYATSQEQEYGLKANLVFQKAVAFVLSHERAHAQLGHLTIGERPLTAQERLDMERDADMAAYDALVSQGLDDNEKLPEAWAVVSVMLSTFYLYEDARNALRPGGHPAVHHRVAHIIERLAMREPHYDYYFKFLCRLVLQAVFPDVLAPERQFDDWEDALADAFDRLDGLAAAP